jgi:4'-phosphopantetheinyl transferase
MNLPPDKWLSPPANFDLKNGEEAHLWRIDLNQDFSAVQSESEILSTDERQRAEKYHFETDKKHFIVARAALREILSRYLDTAPHRVVFSRNQYGKPSISAEISNNLIEFNFSRSREIALCAVTRGRAVGVDIEFINEDSANLEIARRFFSPDEIAALQDIPAELKTAAFYSCWTRKEAFIKAVGKGLSYPLQNFSVSVLPEEIAPLININDLQEKNHWSMFSFTPKRGYAAALAVEGAMPTLCFWQWSKSFVVQK